MLSTLKRTNDPSTPAGPPKRRKTLPRPGLAPTGDIDAYDIVERIAFYTTGTTLVSLVLACRALLKTILESDDKFREFEARVGHSASWWMLLANDSLAGKITDRGFRRFHDALKRRALNCDQVYHPGQMTAKQQRLFIERFSLGGGGSIWSPYATYKHTTRARVSGVVKNFLAARGLYHQIEGETKVMLAIYARQLPPELVDPAHVLQYASKVMVDGVVPGAPEVLARVLPVLEDVAPKYTRVFVALAADPTAPDDLLQRVVLACGRFPRSWDGYLGIVSPHIVKPAVETALTICTKLDEFMWLAEHTRTLCHNTDELPDLVRNVLWCLRSGRWAPYLSYAFVHAVVDRYGDFPGQMRGGPNPYAMKRVLQETALIEQPFKKAGNTVRAVLRDMEHSLAVLEAHLEAGAELRDIHAIAQNSAYAARYPDELPALLARFRRRSKKLAQICAQS